MATIRFVQHAAFRGQHYRPGQELEVDDATAAAYVQVSQAVVISGGESDRKTTRRGKRAETATRPDGEQR